MKTLLPGTSEFRSLLETPEQTEIPKPVLAAKEAPEQAEIPKPVHAAKEARICFVLLR